MTKGRLLDWKDAALLGTLWGADAPPLLRASAAAGLMSGRVRVAVAEGADGALTGLLAQGGEGCWALVAALGADDEAAQIAAFEALTAGARLVVWDAEAAPGWLPRFAAQGARPFERREMVQALDRARPHALMADPALAIVPWPGGEAGEAALDALAAASEATLNGVFLTTPAPPTRAAVRQALANMLASPERPFRPDASFLALHGGRPVGVVLAIAGSAPGELLLLDLLVASEARGRGVARHLVAALQAAAAAAGDTHVRFLTLGHNDPVLRLFHADELTLCEGRRYGCWEPSA